MDGWIDRQTDRQINRERDRQTDRQTDGRTDSRTDGRTDRQTHNCLHTHRAYVYSQTTHTVDMYVYIYIIWKHLLKERQAKTASVGSLLRLGNPIQQQLLDLQQPVTSPTFF